MKTKLIFTILAGLSTCSLAEKPISINSLIERLQANSMESLFALAAEVTFEDGGISYIQLSDRVSEMGSNTISDAKWRIETEDSGLLISLALGQHYLDPKPTFNGLEAITCDYSGASSGTEFIRFDNGTLFEHSWSCGSLGCSFEYIFKAAGDSCG